MIYLKAAILNGYDKKGCDLVVKDIPIPDINDQEVLVKIHIAGVNPLDNMIIRGDVKIIVPYKFPLVMGNEFVGVIDKVGASVDEVFSLDDVNRALQKVAAGKSKGKTIIKI